MTLFHILRSDSHCAYDSDGVVKQRLAKDDDVENFIDVDLLEYGQHCDRVDGGDEGRKQERVQQW